MTEFEERQIEAFTAIGSALRDISAAIRLRYMVEREMFNKLYPAKGEVRDATITHPQTTEEKVRQSQGATDETDEEWIGRREQKILAANEARRQKKGSTP